MTTYDDSTASDNPDPVAPGGRKNQPSAPPTTAFKLQMILDTISSNEWVFDKACRLLDRERVLRFAVENGSEYVQATGSLAEMRIENGVFVLESTLWVSGGTIDHAEFTFTAEDFVNFDGWVKAKEFEIAELEKRHADIAERARNKQAAREKRDERRERKEYERLRKKFEGASA